LNLLAHKDGRNFSVFAFYFAEGVPIGFIWWAMPTLFRQNGVDISVIGSITAALTLPWVFKFLWAPLVDIYRTANFGFTRWIAVTQALMCASLVPLVFTPLQNHVSTWAACLFLHSMFAATQDVSVDALVINIVPNEEKGIINGYMQAGMLIGRSVFGGVILLIVPYIGLQGIVILMIAAILATLCLLFFIKEPNFVYQHRNGLPEFKYNLLQIFHKRQTWYCILFALTAGAAFETAGAFAGPLLIDHSVSQKSIGFFFALPVVAAMLAGGFLGGFISDKVGRKKALTYFLCIIIALVAAIAGVDLSGKLIDGAVLMGIYVLLYFFIGMFTTSSYALFMDVTDRKIGATQFSTFMAATNACEASVVFVAGFITATYNYGSAFIVMSLLSGGSLFFLRKIKITWGRDYL
jgi:MFS transporter, PAT family, beta-lactamase induction signal transducer AmpG